MLLIEVRSLVRDSGLFMVSTNTFMVKISVCSNPASCVKFDQGRKS